MYKGVATYAQGNNDYPEPETTSTDEKEPNGVLGR